MHEDTPLFVALDVATAGDARRLIEAMSTLSVGFKVGHELFLSAGPGFVRELVSAGHPVYLDLKLHEIPASVERATRAAGRLGVRLITVHASGGVRMMRAAREAAAEFPHLAVVAVTVVTHLTDGDLDALGIPDTVLGQSQRLARLVREAELDGVVTSVREAAVMRKLLGPNAMIIAAGVRPAGSDADDQRRVATPAEARDAGASHVVVGRPITRAPNPRQVAKETLQAIQRPRPRAT